MDRDLFSLVGNNGRWQKLILAVTFFANTVGPWQNFAMTYLAPNVPFRCVRPNDSASTDTWPGQCTVRPTNVSEEVPCEAWEYDTEHYSDTVVSQWDLVCDRGWLVSFSKSIYMAGVMTSVFIFGQVADRIGRLRTLYIGWSITSVNLILSIFSPSVEAFLIYRFMLAFGRAGFVTTMVVLLMETVDTQHRIQTQLVAQLGWTLSVITLAFIGYFFRHWMWFQVAISVPFLLVIFALPLMTESPRWLLMRGQTSRVEKVLRKIARRNGRVVDEVVLQHLLKERTVESKKGTILDLFRTPQMRSRILIVMFLWIGTAFVYYGFTYNTNDLFGDPHFNFLLLGLLELPALGLLYLTLPRLGRKPVLVVLTLVGGAASLARLCVPADLPWLTTTLAQGGKFCFTATFRLLYIYTPEMFPTVVRSAALGSCSTVARVGSILAPFVREMGKSSHPSVPNVVYSLLAAIGALLALRLPETQGLKLPDTLHEGETLRMRRQNPSDGETDA